MNNNNAKSKAVELLEKVQRNFESITDKQHIWEALRWRMADQIKQVLKLLQQPECETCGGTGRKPRDKHCSYKGICAKRHEGITCHPNGVQCEYYIEHKPCPKCQNTSIPREPNPKKAGSASLANESAEGKPQAGVEFKVLVTELEQSYVKYISDLEQGNLELQSQLESLRAESKRLIGFLERIEALSYGGHRCKCDRTTGVAAIHVCAHRGLTTKQSAELDEL